MHLTPEWRLAIKPISIQNWMAKYLQSPNDREKRLERDPKACVIFRAYFMGLITALFVAGTSSVVGTLWSIESPMGRSCASHFYRNIDNENKDLEATGCKVKVP